MREKRWPKISMPRLFTIEYDLLVVDFGKCETGHEWMCNGGKASCETGCYPGLAGPLLA